MVIVRRSPATAKKQRTFKLKQASWQDRKKTDPPIASRAITTLNPDENSGKPPTTHGISM